MCTCRTINIKILVTILTICILAIGGCSKQSERFVRKLHLNGKLEFVGSYPLSDGDTPEANCYHMIYDDSGRLASIQYFKRKRPAIDDEYNISSISLSYENGFENRIYYVQDEVSHSIRIKRDSNGYPLAKYLYNEENVLIADNNDISQYKYIVHDTLLRIGEYRQNENGELLSGRDGIAISEQILDGQGYLKRAYFFDKEHSPVGIYGSDAISVEFRYDEFGNTLKKAFYNSIGTLVQANIEAPMIKFIYDSVGNLTELTYYGMDERIRNLQSEDYARVKCAYDEYGNLNELSFWDEDNNPAQLNRHMTKCEYDIWGNLYEIAYYDSSGNLGDTIWGPPITRYIHNENRDLLEKGYYIDDTTLMKGQGIFSDIAKVVKTYDSAGNAVDVIFYDEKGLRSFAYYKGTNKYRPDYSNEQYILGQLYFLGEGVEKNDVFAYLWLNWADSLGHKGACSFLDSIRGFISDDAVEKAQFISSAWVPGKSLSEWEELYSNKKAAEKRNTQKAIFRKKVEDIARRMGEEWEVTDVNDLDGDGVWEVAMIMLAIGGNAGHWISGVYNLVGDSLVRISIPENLRLDGYRVRGEIKFGNGKIIIKYPYYLEDDCMACVSWEATVIWGYSRDEGIYFIDSSKRRY